MSCFSGPEITNNGLVLYYDMNNTQKSWKGAPTTNLLSGPNTFTNTYWALQNMTRTSSIEIAPDGTPTASLFTVTTGYTPLYQQKSGQTAGATFTMSGHFKAGTGTAVYLTLGNTGLINQVYALFNLTTGTITSTVVMGTGTYINSAITSLGNGWYRCQVTGIVDSSATLIRTDYVFPNSSTIYGCNMQLEVGSFATPFIDGSRTTSTALLDLTNNNTITTSSLTYASDNTFSFNGSSNWIESPSSTLFDTQAVTMESWVKPAALSQNGFLFEKGLVNSQYSNFFSGVNFYFRTYAISNTDLTFVVATYITLNQWNHIVCTYGSGVKTIYVNGIQVAQATGITGTLNTNQGNQYIGKYGSLSGTPYPFSGSIGVSKVYNRSLSAAEVSQNFNALRGRYGI